MESSGCEQESEQTNAAEQMNNEQKPTIQCDHCQCMFDCESERDEHMFDHYCWDCSDIAVGDDERVHRLRHRQEAQVENLRKQRQRKIDEDFMFGYVKVNRLNEYRSQLDEEPDFNYIVFNYRFEKGEWLSFVKMFKRPFLKLFFDNFIKKSYDQADHLYLIAQTNAEMIACLLENRVLSVHDAIDFLNILMVKVGYDDYVSVIISHLLDEGCKIKAEWVARAISDDELIDRIKEKQIFTFGDIHKARQWNTFSPDDILGLKRFHAQIQKHFFNPDFENPLDNSRGGDLVLVKPGCQYSFDEKNDELSMLVKTGCWSKTVSLGSCAELKSKSLNELVKEYINEVKIYDAVKKQLNDLRGDFEDIDEPDSYYQAVHRQKMMQLRKVSKLYFAISIE